MLRKYPKMTVIVLSYILFLLVFYTIDERAFDEIFLKLGIVGIFITGTLYTYGFTGGLATFLIILIAKDNHPIFLAIIGGLGALTADLTIFRLIRNGLNKEINHLARTRFFKAIGSWPVIKHRISRDILGLLVIASPLPDEFGIAILSRDKLIGSKLFAVIAFLTNAIGIYIIATASRFF